MSQVPRRIALAFLCLSAVAFFLGGCGGDPSPPVQQIPILSQEEADDVAQQMGVLLAANLGGWMYEIRATQAAVPISGPQSLRRTRIDGVQRDTVIASGAMTYGINYQYRQNNGDLAAVWDTSAVEIQALSNAIGTLAAPPRHNGTYQHHNDFEVLGIHASEDTLTFSGLADDTSLATMENTFTHETKFYFMSLFVDFTFQTLKDGSNPYPIGGGECNVTVDADRQTSLDRNTAVRNLLVDFTIAFDGTATPLVTIVEDPGDPRTIFRYRVNLDDGTVVRAP